MNGRFRKSFSGFNREEVLDYIKQLSEEKANIEEDNLRYKQELEDRDFKISWLENLLYDCSAELHALSDKYHEINELLESSVNELSQISTDVSTLNDAYMQSHNNIPPVSGCSEDTH